LFRVLQITTRSAIIDDIKGKHAIGLADIAYYYFDFRDFKKQDCYGLLSSLILQLSVQSDPCSKILSKLYLDNGPVLTPTLIALNACIKDMLSLPGQGPIYIIVDGVDECPNSSGTRFARGKVLELIKELVDLQLPNVHLCVASRPEIDIQKVLESLKSLQISLHDETGQVADINAYIKSRVNSKSVLDWTEEDENLVINTISRKANGM
jgi:NACHT domain-containing protein